MAHYFVREVIERITERIMERNKLYKQAYMLKTIGRNAQAMTNLLPQTTYST